MTTPNPRRRTPRELAEEADAMAVVLAQPHRRGISANPNDAWLSTALGRFCARLWTRKELQREFWEAGERFAQLIDAERIARGLAPRQCAEASTPGESMTDAERLEVRRATALRLRQAETAIGDPWAVRDLRRLAWDDLSLYPYDEPKARDGLRNLARHFEEFDRASRCDAAKTS